MTPPQPDYKKVWTLFRRPVTPGPEVVPRREVVFHGADPDTSYTVKVTLVLNGQAIAVSQEHVLLPHRKRIVTLIYIGPLLIIIRCLNKMYQPLIRMLDRSVYLCANKPPMMKVLLTSIPMSGGDNLFRLQFIIVFKKAKSMHMQNCVLKRVTSRSL